MDKKDKTEGTVTNPLIAYLQEAQEVVREVTAVTFGLLGLCGVVSGFKVLIILTEFVRDLLG